VEEEDVKERTKLRKETRFSPLLLPPAPPPPYSHTVSYVRIKTN